MTAGVFCAMALSAWRDRGALAMALLLPPLMFLVFATAFAGTSGTRLEVRLAAFAAQDTAATSRFVDAVRRAPFLRGDLVVAGSRADLEARVRGGEVDAGLLISAAGAASRPDVVVVEDPGKAIASSLLVASLGEIVDGRMPGSDGPPQPAGVSIETTSPLPRGTISAAYYAGGVTTLFLLFAAVQSAMTLIEERNAGLLDRILAGPGSAAAVVLGKFAFMVLQGIGQCVIVFAVADLAYGVDPLRRPLPWLVTTCAAAAAAAALALGLAAACRTRQQAQAASTFAILVMSAVGGSMAPRFTMPTWLQHLGWLTPNTWIIEAYQDSLWRGLPTGGLVTTWLALLGFTALGLAAAAAIELRR